MRSLAIQTVIFLSLLMLPVGMNGQNPEKVTSTDKVRIALNTFLENHNIDQNDSIVSLKGDESDAICLLEEMGYDGPIKEKGTTVYALADGISTVEFSYCDEDGIVAKITINISNIDTKTNQLQEMKRIMIHFYTYNH